LPLRFIGALVCSLTTTMALAPTAFAGGTGGVAATEAPAAPKTSSKPKLHTDPVTARTPDVAYSGPVYMRTTTGQVVPYVPVAASTQPAAPQASAAATGGVATATTEALTPGTGALAPAKPELLVPGTLARYVDGIAAAPMGVPLAVQEIIWTGDQIIGLPYIYGGGHASFTSPGYDCSGTVSFALHGASLLPAPEDSSEFMAWGSHGVGRWVTIFSNPEHAYMTVAGLRLDTSSADDPSNQQGPRWRPLRPANPGFTVRHPLGL